MKNRKDLPYSFALKKKLLTISDVQARSIKLREQGAIDDLQLSAITTAMFLEGFTSFEESIENLAIKILSKNGTYRHLTVLARTDGKIKIQNMLSDRSFIDWFPLNVSMKKLDRHFVNPIQNPFRPPLNFLGQDLTNSMHLRNAICHKSEKSQFEFNELLSREAMGLNIKSPAEFLLSSLTSKKNRLIFYFDVFHDFLWRVESSWATIVTLDKPPILRAINKTSLAGHYG